MEPAVWLSVKSEGSTWPLGAPGFLEVIFPLSLPHVFPLRVSVSTRKVPFL